MLALLFVICVYIMIDSP